MAGVHSETRISELYACPSKYSVGMTDEGALVFTHDGEALERLPPRNFGIYESVEDVGLALPPLLGGDARANLEEVLRRTAFPVPSLLFVKKRPTDASGFPDNVRLKSILRNPMGKSLDCWRVPAARLVRGISAGNELLYVDAVTFEAGFSRAARERAGFSAGEIPDRAFCESRLARFDPRSHILLVVPGSTIRDRIKFFILTLTGKRIEGELGRFDTVGDMKRWILSEEGIPLEQQRLIFAGKQLEDSRMLYEYGVKDESRVHLVLRCRGGPGRSPATQRTMGPYPNATLQRRRRRPPRAAPAVPGDLAGQAAAAVASLRLTDIPGSRSGWHDGRQKVLPVDRDAVLAVLQSFCRAGTLRVQRGGIHKAKLLRLLCIRARLVAAGRGGLFPSPPLLRRIMQHLKHENVPGQCLLRIENVGNLGYGENPSLFPWAFYRLPTGEWRLGCRPTEAQQDEADKKVVAEEEARLRVIWLASVFEIEAPGLPAWPAAHASVHRHRDDGDGGDARSRFSFHQTRGWGFTRGSREVAPSAVRAAVKSWPSTGYPVTAAQVWDAVQCKALAGVADFSQSSDLLAPVDLKYLTAVFSFVPRTPLAVHKSSAQQPTRFRVVSGTRTLAADQSRGCVLAEPNGNLGYSMLLHELVQGVGGGDFGRVSCVEPRTRGAPWQAAVGVHLSKRVFDVQELCVTAGPGTPEERALWHLAWSFYT